MSIEPFRIRHSTAADAEAIVDLIRELAIYEKLEMFAKATPDAIRECLFGPRPFAEAIVAEVDKQPVGFALFFYSFSSFRGQPGAYLEDLFVRPDHRGLGIGKALLSSVARIARDRGCGRLEWSVLDWNTPAIGFYRSLGAIAMDEWTIYRVHEDSLDHLASLAPELAGTARE